MAAQGEREGVAESRGGGADDGGAEEVVGVVGEEFGEAGGVKTGKSG